MDIIFGWVSNTKMDRSIKKEGKMYKATMTSWHIMDVKEGHRK